jgi:hypothetical protein
MGPGAQASQGVDETMLVEGLPEVRRVAIGRLGQLGAVVAGGERDGNAMARRASSRCLRGRITASCSPTPPIVP